MLNNLNILTVTYEYPPLGGGGGIATKVLAEELVRRGHSISILTTHINSQKYNEITNGVKIYRVPVFGRKDLNKASMISLLTWPILSILFGLYLLLKNRFDLINTQFFVPSGVTSLILGFVSRTPNVIYAHGADVYDPERLNHTASGRGLLSWLLKNCIKIQAKFARGLMSQSDDTKQRLLSIIGNKYDVKVVALPFKPIQESRIKNKGSKKSQKQFKLVTVGRLVKRKGFNYLIESFKNLPKDITLTIIGDGPERENLESLIQDYDLSGRIRLAGYVSEEEKYRLLSESSCFVLSSLHEGMGIVVQEAMEAGLPIISTNIGGQNDLLKNNVNAILIDPADSKALTDAIISLKDNKAMQQLFIKYNYELIKKYYPANIVNRYEKYFYEKLSSK